MTNLTIAWLILTIPVTLLGYGLVANANENKKTTERGIWIATLFLFLPLWWGIYFLIK